MTKAEEVFTKVESLIASGMTKSDALKALAAKYGQPVDSIRGAYYAHKRSQGVPSARPKRRETTPEDALAQARAALERAIANIDREVDAAKERADTAAAEYRELKASAADRKATIAGRLETLQ